MTFNIAQQQYGKKIDEISHKLGNRRKILRVLVLR